jgi:N-succinyldiaminopimelate aminotransferase
VIERAPASVGFTPAKRLAGARETVFARYARLAARTGAVNLGQGFPDDPPPALVLAALARGSAGGHQYAPLPGSASLRTALARSEARHHGRALDPDTDVQVTVGATEGLFAALLGLVDVGDEVILIEPVYDAYAAMVRLAGGVPVGVALELDGAGTWRLDPDRVAGAIGPRTRVLLVNDPHNPTGTVLDAATATALVDVAVRAGLVILVDHVYAHLAFRPSVPIAALAPDRTLVVGSAGKTFGVTGWKVGWVTGPDELVAAVRGVHQWVTFAVATPLQAAVAELIEGVDRGGDVDELLEAQRLGLAARRDLLVDGLRRAGFDPTRPDAGYFVLADASDWSPGAAYADDVALCDALPEIAGVVAIPGSAFRCTTSDAGRRWLRFAFCGHEATVVEGARRLHSAARA